MKFGAIYPQTETGGDPAALDAIGRAVEAQGYDYLLMFDHVIGAVHEGREPKLWGPYTERDPFHDPMIAFAYLAGITKRLELATGIIILPQRQTVLFARQAADIDLVSNGRLRLGVAIGWNPVEYDALGQDFRVRGKRLDEQIQFLRRLWTESPMSFQGKYDRIDRAGLNPLPKRRIPIWLGGISEPAFKRAAALTDGFIFSGPWDRILSGWTKLQAELKAQGRDLKGFGAEYLIPRGTKVEEVVDTARRWQDAGGTHLGVRTMDLGFKTAQQHIDYFAEARAKL